ncbi:hypothetical protein [Histophilus somni]|uniref:Haemophilus somnus cryptic prophage genes, capsid scaffolding protein n=1 Tax=Histophilus somni TaxID=731 RepID=Q48285_HISSO|nr:hypothetical protein [Histophilus somni]AAC45163.1 orf9 [Histophilus somni]
MTDQVDRANEYTEIMQQLAIQKHQQKTREKSTVKYCLDCQEEIPEIRQKNGYCRCIDCQRIIEKHQRIYRYSSSIS